MTEKPSSDKKNEKKPAPELDDESLLDRLFPDEVIKWVKDTFGRDEKDEEE